MRKQVGVLGVVAVAVVLFGGAATASANSPYDFTAVELLEEGHELAMQCQDNTGDAHLGEYYAYKGILAAMAGLVNNDQDQWYQAYIYGLWASQFMLVSYDQTGDPDALFAATYLFNGAMECLGAYLSFV
jgi:hypothetical protein